MEREERRGNALIVGVSLATLIGFAALSVDVGTVRVARTQHQGALDAASLSGVGYLDGTEDGITAARDAAIQVASENRVLGDPIRLTSADVEVGTWDDTVVPAFAAWRAGDDPMTVNAVRIRHSAPQAAPALGTAAFGAAGYDLDGDSLAVRSQGQDLARTTQCYLPLVVPDCVLDGLAPGTNPPAAQVTFDRGHTHNLAWGMMRGVSPAALRDQILGQCDYRILEVGQRMFVNDAAHPSALMRVADVLNERTGVEPGMWDVPNLGPLPVQGPSSDVLGPFYGRTLEGPVALVDTGGDCVAPDLSSGTLEVTGVAWAVLYDVQHRGHDKHLWVQLDMVREHDVWGEIDNGVEGVNVFGASPPILVNGG